MKAILASFKNYGKCDENIEESVDRVFSITSAGTSSSSAERRIDSHPIFLLVLLVEQDDSTIECL